MSVLLKNFRNLSKILHATSDGVVNVARRSMSENIPNPKTSTLKLSLLGLGFGTIVGTGYSIHKLNQPRGHIINEETVISTLENIPQHKPSKQILIPGDDSGLKLTLYQYRTCPFCCKVRSFLDYYGISYDIIEVDPVLKQSIKWSEYKKVPILLAKVGDSYQPLNDSTMIVSVLSSYLQSQSGGRQLPDLVKCYPRMKYMDEGGVMKSEVMNRYFLMLDHADNSKINVEEIVEERKWRKWADDVLVHMLSPNVYRTRNEALQSFNWFSEVGEWEKHFPAWERYLIIYVGAAAMWGIGKRLKKKYNLKDDVRQSLYDECNYFAKAVNVKGTPFIGGKKPSLGDLAVYGVLSSIEGCDAFKDLLNHSNIKKWYYNMRDEVENHHGSAYASMQ